MTLRPRRTIDPNKLRPQFRVIPEYLENECRKCDSCENFYKIPWNQEYEFEQHPIQSADGRIWVISEISIDCPLCWNKTALKFPFSKLTERVELFSDEAERDLKAGWRLSLNSFVGVGTNHLNEIERDFLELKSRLAPTIDPSSWVSHATDIFSGDRRRNLLGVDVSKEDSIAFLKKAANLIREKCHTDWIHVVGSIAKNTEKVRHSHFVLAQRESVITAAYILIVDFFVSQGIRPEFHFEAQRVSETDQVDEWIERVIRRLGKSIAVMYIQRTSAINLPIMIKKGSDIRLELADIIAFIVARSIHCKSINRQPEIDPLELGPIWYHFWNGQRVGGLRSEGLPWDHFFGESQF